MVIGIFVGLYFGFYGVSDDANSPTENGADAVNTPVSGNGGGLTSHIPDTNNNNNNNEDNEKDTETKNSDNEKNDSKEDKNDKNGKNEQREDTSPMIIAPNTPITADKDGIFRPKCENGIFSAVSWESVTSMISNDNSICYNQKLSQENANTRLLTPSDPDRIVSAYFDCVINDVNTNVCPKLGVKSFNPNNDINAQIIRGSVALRSKSMDFVNSAPQMECINSIYDNIDIKYGPYNDNERYQECINVRLSFSKDSINSKTNSNDLFMRDGIGENTPSLRVEFILDTIDLEQGFDHLSLSWVYNNAVFDHDYVTWTGNDVKATDESNDINKPPLFWNVLPGDSVEICLNLESDDSITGKGFEGHFEMREQLGKWSDWTDCQTAESKMLSRWDGVCGIGVHSKHRICPKEETIKNNTHICNEKEEFLNEFCEKAKCETVDNTKVTDMPNNIKDDEGWIKHKWNGVNRIDPVYPDPFRYLQSGSDGNRKIDISSIKSEIISKMEQIESRYDDKREVIFGVGEINHYSEMTSRLEKRLLKSLLLGRRFVLSFTGSSNTAGHDNMFMSSYSMQLQSIMRPFWQKIGYFGSSFVVHNAAVGGHLGTNKLRWCVSQFSQNDADMVFWESLMNDAGYKNSYDYFETWVRNVVTMPKHPLYGVISTGDATGRYGDACPKPYCAMTNKVNLYWWKQVEPMYAEMKNGYYMATVAFRRGCANLYETKDECKDLTVTWHPGPHGHRLNAEVLAHFYLRVTLDGLNKYGSQINDLLTKDKQPTLGLECLLGEKEGPKWDSKKHEYLSWQDKKGVSGLDSGKYCQDTCSVSPSWCISSYYPMPQHNRIGEFVVDKFKINERTEHISVNASKDFAKQNAKAKASGWYAQDDVDKSVHPLIFRHGGQAPIDHKVEFETDVIGSVLNINVKVPSKAILVLEPISGGGEEWLEQFKFKVDGNNVECKGNGKTASGYNYKEKGFCLISATKGKHVLAIEYGKKVSSHKKAAIDMIVGI